MCDDCPRISADYDYGVKVPLTCRNHPDLRWFTKNISHIGARSVFYATPGQPECACSLSDLIIASPRPAA